MAKVPLLSSHEVHLVRQVLRATNFHNLRMEEADKELLMDLRKRMFVYLEKSHHPYWKASRKWKKEMDDKDAEEAKRKRMKQEYKAKLTAWHALCKHKREIRKARVQARKLAKQNRASKPT